MLHLSNKKGGLPLNFNDCKRFRNYINECELIDLLVLGSPFTWHKNDAQEHLDRAFSNSAWLHTWPSSHVAHLAHSKFDHCPILVKIKEDVFQATRQFNFKFNDAGYLITSSICFLKTSGI